MGDYNYHNLLSAIGIGQFFKIPDHLIKAALESYVPTNKRSQLVKVGSTSIVLDAYNANPTSMRAALTSFQDKASKNKAVILGDMFELGDSMAQEHQEILDLAIELGFRNITLVGENFYQTSGSGIKKYRDYITFEKAFDKSAFENARILIKGSRGMALERVIALFD